MKVKVEKISKQGIDLRRSEDLLHDVNTFVIVDSNQEFDLDQLDWHTPIVPAVIVRVNSDDYIMISFYETLTRNLSSLSKER